MLHHHPYVIQESLSASLRFSNVRTYSSSFYSSSLVRLTVLISSRFSLPSLHCSPLLSFASSSRPSSCLSFVILSFHPCVPFVARNDGFVERASGRGGGEEERRGAVLPPPCSPFP